MGVDDNAPVIPEWARYLAVDADGSVWAYPSEPQRFDGREWGGHEDGEWPGTLLWHPEANDGKPMPPALACRLIVPLATRPAGVQ